jgi:hypothetical protein
MSPTALLMLRSGMTRSLASDVNKYSTFLAGILSPWTTNTPSCPNGIPESGKPCYTPGGLAWEVKWGSSRQAANMALIATGYAALMPSKPTTRTDLCFAHDQSGRQIYGQHPVHLFILDPQIKL